MTTLKILAIYTFYVVACMLIAAWLGLDVTALIAGVALVTALYARYDN